MGDTALVPRQQPRSFRPLLCSTMGGSELSGLIAAIISALCNGSFAAVAKLDAVEKSDINPIVFNTYVSMGVFVSSFLVPRNSQSWPFRWPGGMGWYCHCGVICGWPHRWE